MRVVLSNSYGTLNKGDEAILTVLVRELVSAGHDVGILTFTPAATALRQPGARVIRSGVLRGTLATFRAIREADLLIIGGGGIIQDATSMGNLVFHLSRAVMARITGTPYAFCGVGIGPLRRSVCRRLTATACAAAARISVRDAQSATLLASLGVDNVEIEADLAHLLEPADSASREDLARRRASGRPRIGLSMRPPVGHARQRRRSTAAFEAYLERGARLADALVDVHDAEIVFVSMHPEQDDQLAVELARRMRRADRLVAMSGALTPGEIKSVLARLDLLIGTRLHAIILAACNGVPVIGIGYDEKIRGYLEELGLGEYLLEARDWQVDTATRLAAQALHDSARIRDQLNDRVPELVRRARQAIAATLTSAS